MVDAFTNIRFEQDFSNNSDGFSDETNGWSGGTTEVASGTNGIISPDGNGHSIFTQTDAAGGLTGPFTRFDSYRSLSTNQAFSTQIKIYLDPDALAAGEGFNYSVAANNQSGSHLRDFIFHVTKDTSTGDLLVGNSNNTNFDPREDLETIDNAVITEAGWYTFEHVFTDSGSDTLAVQMRLINDADQVVFDNTIDSGDSFSNDFGGNRYGWFTNIDVAGGIAVDDLQLLTESDSPVEVRDGNTIIGQYDTIAEAKAAIDNGDISGAALEISTNGLDDATFYVADGMSIQAAIDAAEDGDTIEVGAGSYVGDLTIDKAITLVGANSGLSGDDAGRGVEAIIDGRITLASDDVTIDGFEFAGSGTAIRGGASVSEGYSNITIENNDFVSGSGQVILNGFSQGGDPAGTSSNWTISSNRFDGITGNNSTAMRVENIDGLTIQDNVINHDDAAVSGRRGIQIDNSQNVTVDGNTVDMGVTDFSDAGAVFSAALYSLQFSMDDDGSSRTVSNVSVTNNTFIGSYDGVITLDDGTVDGLTFDGNTFDGHFFGIRFAAATGSAGVQGVQRDIDVTNNTFGNNHFGAVGFDNRPENEPFEDVNVSSNTFNGDTVGIVHVDNAGFELSGNSTFEGSDGDDELIGGAGVDTLNGNGGDDLIVASGGNDTIDGGAGSDTYDASLTTGGVTVNLTSNPFAAIPGLAPGTGFATGGEVGVDGLTSIENFAGGSGNDAFVGDAGDNTMIASAGNDSFVGGGGVDTYDASAGSADQTIDLGGGTASSADFGSDTLNGVEAVEAGSGDDSVFGDANANTLSGNDGQDDLQGAGGDDTLLGGAGDDRLTGGDGDDDLQGGAGQDTAVYAGNKADFTIDSVAMTVTDNNAGDGDEGVDSLNGVEIIEFADSANEGRILIVGGDSEFQTIQSAVTAALDGDTIWVSPGSYEEDLTIDKAVTLNGPNAGVLGHDSGARTAEASIKGNVVIAADGASLAGFTLTKPDASTSANNINFTGWNGINLDVQADNVTVENNIVEAFGAHGGFAGSGFVRFGGEGSFDGNLVEAGAGYDAAGDARGVSALWINADSDDDVTVDNNHLLVSTDNADGLFLNNAGEATVSNNLISGTDGGFVAFGDYGQLTLEGNTIENFDATGIRLFESLASTKPDVVLSGNDVNGDNAVFAGGAVQLGDQIGGSGFPQLLANIEGVPAIYRANDLDGDYGVLVNGNLELYADQADAVAAAGSDGVIWNFADEEFQVFGGMSIQAAIDAAAEGDTIDVGSGTFTENLLVDKGVTLLGAQSGEAATGSARAGGESVIDGPGTFAITVTADNVTIDGFEISGFGRDGINVRTLEDANPSDASIGAYRSNINIENNWIHNDDASGQRNGIVIGEFSGDPARSSEQAEIEGLTVSGNHIDIDSSGGRGMAFTNHFDFITLTDAVIDGNTFDAATSFFGSAGPDTFRIEGAEITSNTFTGIVNSYNLFNSLIDGNTFEYIALLGVDGSTVSNNTFNVSDFYGLGLWGDEFGSNASQNSTVEGNTFNYNYAATA